MSPLEACRATTDGARLQASPLSKMGTVVQAAAWSQSIAVSLPPSHDRASSTTSNSTVLMPVLPTES